MDKREAIRHAMHHITGAPLGPFQDDDERFAAFEAALRERGYWIAPWEPSEAMMLAFYLYAVNVTPPDPAAFTPALSKAYIAMRDAALDEEG